MKNILIIFPLVYDKQGLKLIIIYKYKFYTHVQRLNLFSILKN